MKIPSNILSDITADVSNLLVDAAEAHMETGRRATVTLKLTINRDKETGKRVLRGKVSASIPEGVEDSHARKCEPVTLLSVSDDHPGQQRIAE